MAASASKSGTTTCANGGVYTVDVSFSETGTSGNSSTVNVYADFKNGNQRYSGNYDTSLELIWYDNVNNTGGLSLGTKTWRDSRYNEQGGDAPAGGIVRSISSTITVPHNSSGTCSGYAKAVYTANNPSGYRPPSVTVQTANTALTPISLKPTISTFTVTPRNTTSVTYSFTADMTIDVIQYSTDNGNTWYEKNITDGSSGTFTISTLSSDGTTALSPNTTYNCRLKVRGKDSQIWSSQSAKVAVTTYNTPTQELNWKTDTAINIKWTASANVDYISYSIDGGSTYVDVGSVNAKTGNYTISGLSIGTTYSVRTRVRWKDSQATNVTAKSSIATYALPTQEFVSKTETGVSIKWTASDTIDYVEYSTDNGSTWKTNNCSGNIGSVSAKTGTYTISSLAANTNYKIKTRLRWKNSQVKSVTAATSQTTYQYPYVSAVGTGNLKIGNSQTLTLYNPLGRSCTVYMKKDSTSGTQLYSGTTNGTSLTFTPAANTLYNSLPSSTSGTAVYYCTYSSQTVSNKTGTYYLDSSDSTFKPTIAAANWSYVSDYSGNNQVAIKGRSNVTVTVNTAATPYTGTTIKNYTVKWGSLTGTITGTTGSVTLSNGTEGTIKVIANDNRGLSSTESSKTIQIINYTDQTLTSAKANRVDGITSEVHLNLKGTYYAGNFGTGTSNNTITAVKYYTSTNNSTWNGPYTIPISSVTLNNGTLTLNDYRIYYNGSSTDFTVGTKYYLKFNITDNYQTRTFTGYIISAGDLAIDCYKDNNGYHRGINGLADDDYTLKVHGNINATNGFIGNLTGNADTSSKLGTTNKGNANKPIYLSSGTPTEGNEYVPKTGGTFTGDVLTDTWFYAGKTTDNANRCFVARNSSKQGRMMVDTSGNFGLYDVTKSKWIVYSNSSGDVTLNGNASTSTKATQDANGVNIHDSLYFKKNETYRINNSHLSFSGLITGSGKDIYFTIPLPKMVNNISTVTINALTLSVRHVGGGYISANGANFMTDANTAAYSVDVKMGNLIGIKISGTNSWGATNNTPVSVSPHDVKVTFT